MKTYWNGQGRLQNEYNELETDINFKWAKAEEKAKYKYRRYYNDGDLPKGACYASKDDIQAYLEFQANIAVAKGYRRKHKGEEIPALIRFFANRTFQGFTVWQNGGAK